MMKQKYIIWRFTIISQIKQKSPASQQGFFYVQKQIPFTK